MQPSTAIYQTTFGYRMKHQQLLLVITTPLLAILPHPFIHYPSPYNQTAFGYRIKYLRRTSSSFRTIRPNRHQQTPAHNTNTSSIESLIIRYCNPCNTNASTRCVFSNKPKKPPSTLASGKIPIGNALEGWFLQYLALFLQRRYYYYHSKLQVSSGVVANFRVDWNVVVAELSEGVWSFTKGYAAQAGSLTGHSGRFWHQQRQHCETLIMNQYVQAISVPVINKLTYERRKVVLMRTMDNNWSAANRTQRCLMNAEMEIIWELRDRVRRLTSPSIVVLRSAVAERRASTSVIGLLVFVLTQQYAADGHPLVFKDESNAAVLWQSLMASGVSERQGSPCRADRHPVVRAEASSTDRVAMVRLVYSNNAVWLQGSFRASSCQAVPQYGYFILIRQLHMIPEGHALVDSLVRPLISSAEMAKYRIESDARLSGKVGSLLVHGILCGIRYRFFRMFEWQKLKRQHEASARSPYEGGSWLGMAGLAAETIEEHSANTLEAEVDDVRFVGVVLGKLRLRRSDISMTANTNTRQGCGGLHQPGREAQYRRFGEIVCLTVGGGDARHRPSS
ncbi:uncharacterized protein MYCFIDRAFT_208718 [Pseudocercospora fijiensis CIRAD86]|uniref:Uncharacterized protein n=1 Tax=Pseudocercospora fijiensis (strain CIRAD86) TaxID=383855 RepID=M2YNC3_PSEFD|nr:uncharacterized protein MYCFIDRAFT_208718 [Pseudocercospora fijiensis CIRAD86]EME79205.1 hypothetical protein MYCFIDRAFT_208718 [Pseudocercospora fijiensis CIRAD86]